MKHDLKRAKVSYKTNEGQADFHSLRHTYLSRLGRSGASPKAMQRLARHTTVELTLGRYTHANLYDLAAAVNGLPPLPGITSPLEGQAEIHRATGTDDVEVGNNVLPLCLPKRSASDCNSVHLGAVVGDNDSSVMDQSRRNKKAPNDREKPAVEASSGSGWESNPPGDFSAATLGLKPRAVTRSAYTPGNTYRS